MIFRRKQKPTLNKKMKEEPSIEQIRELLPDYTNIVEATCQIISKANKLATTNPLFLGSAAYDIFTDIKDDLESFTKLYSVTSIVRLTVLRDTWNQLSNGDSEQFTLIVNGTRDTIIKYFDLKNDKLEEAIEDIITAALTGFADAVPEIVRLGTSVGEQVFNVYASIASHGNNFSKLITHIGSLVSKAKNYWGKK